ncbi:MAG: vWA domain-containing protein, partial [Myxococcota bacterium]
MTRTYLVSLLTSLTLAACSMKNPEESSDTMSDVVSESNSGVEPSTLKKEKESIGSQNESEIEADSAPADAIGGLIGAKGTQVGAGGLGAPASPDVQGMIEYESAPIGLMDAGEGGMALGGVGVGGGGAGYGRIGSVSGRAGVKSASRRSPRPNVRPRPTVAHLSERFVSNTEGYTDHGVNAFTAVKDDAKSTFSIDVDTASYTMSRRKLQQGSLPAWEAVRVEEFVNYFDYSYDDPRVGPFAVHMEAMPDPFRRNSHILRVGVQAKRYHPKERPPLHLTFLADVSGSMSSADKLGLAKESMHTMVDNLQEGDTVALATYAGRVARILEPTDASNASRIHRAIESLNSGGSTAMSS